MNGGWKMLLVACALLSQCCDAGTTVFFDRPSFLAQLSTSTTFTFETTDGYAAAPSPLSSFGNGSVISTSVDGPASIGIYAPVVWNQVLTGRTESAGVGEVSFLVPVQLSFVPSVYAVGFDAIALATSGAAESVVVVNYADAAPTQQILHEPPDGSNNEGFIGLVSTDPIAGIEVYAAAPGAENVIGQYGSALDNFTIGTPVPEPALAGGLLVTALGLLRHRSRRMPVKAIMGHANPAR